MFKNVTINCKIQKEPLKKMTYGFVDTKLGKMFMGYWHEDGLIHIGYLHFAGERSIEYFANDIKKRWPDTDFYADADKTQEAFEAQFNSQKGREAFVILNGSTFQNKVWSALLKIPYGEERSYSEVATMIDRPTAVRAVSNAVAKNDIAVFVPCHRVKAKTGGKHKYRWGSDLKAKILADEQRGLKKMS